MVTSKTDTGRAARTKAAKPEMAEQTQGGGATPPENEQASSAPEAKARRTRRTQPKAETVAEPTSESTSETEVNAESDKKVNTEPEPVQPEADAIEVGQTKPTLDLRISTKVLTQLVKRAAAAAAGASAGRTPQCLTMLLLQANRSAQTLTVSGYNMSVSLQARVECSVHSGGDLLVSPRCLIGILERMPEETYVNLNTGQDGKHLEIQCPGIDYSEKIASSNAFPEQPTMEPGDAEFRLSVAHFGRALSAVGSVVKTRDKDGENQQIESMICLQFWEMQDYSIDSFAALWTNRSDAVLYTSAEKKHDLLNPDQSVVLPGAALAPLKQSCFATGGFVNCRTDQQGRWLQVEASTQPLNEDEEPVEIKLSIRLGQMEYPHLRHVVNAPLSQVSALVDYQQLIDALNRQEAAGTEWAHLGVTPDELLLNSQADGRQMREIIAAETRGGADEITIRFKPLLSTIKTVEAEQVRVVLESQTRKDGSSITCRLRLEPVGEDLLIVSSARQDG